jgi:hypothetical protein
MAELDELEAEAEAEARTCCVCLEALEAGAKARFCVTCETACCLDCMLRYVKEMCTVGLKCPSWKCVAEVTELELTELFSKAFVKNELTRIQHARLLKEDAMHLPAAKLVFVAGAPLGGAGPATGARACGARQDDRRVP